jgi:electron transport complex protein RnfG
MKTALKPMLLAATVLTVVAAISAGALARYKLGPRERIVKSEQERLLRQLNALVPARSYDNDLASDTLQLRVPELDARDPVIVYRARRAGAPVAAILTVVAPDGYSGDIRLLVGIEADGRVAGVRVLEHRETPGLGDKIDLDRADWILDFNGRSLTDPAPAQWAVRKDGGIYDQFAGATITPRAVVKAVKQALAYFRQNQVALFAPAAPTP